MLTSRLEALVDHVMDLLALLGLGESGLTPPCWLF